MSATTVWIIVILIYSVIFAFACSYLAKEKGKDPSQWAVIGFFLGFIGLIVLGFSKDESSQELTGHERYKKCPDCAEKILTEAKKCRYCGFAFSTHDESYDNLSGKSKTITFADKQLENAIRKKINKTEITQDDMEQICELSLFDLGINNLEGIQHAVNLKVLMLWGNNISDLTPLEQLTELTKLDIGKNNITDIDSLLKLKNLKYIELRNNPLLNKLRVNSLKRPGVTVYS